MDMIEKNLSKEIGLNAKTAVLGEFFSN